MAERLTGFDYCFTRCMQPGADKQEIREDCSLYKVCLERQIFEKLQRYEDLAEQGRLIELPCAVRDTVYTFAFGKVVTGEIVNIKYECEAENYGVFIRERITTIGDYSTTFDFWDIGKTVFLTREEAEAALKGEKE